jgi:hypothetical protein
LPTEIFDAELRAGFLLSSTLWALCTMGCEFAIFLPMLSPGMTIFPRTHVLLAITVGTSAIVTMSAVVTPSVATDWGDNGVWGAALGVLGLRISRSMMSNEIPTTLLWLIERSKASKLTSSMSRERQQLQRNSGLRCPRRYQSWTGRNNLVFEAACRCAYEWSCDGLGH